MHCMFYKIIMHFHQALCRSIMEESQLENIGKFLHHYICMCVCVCVMFQCDSVAIYKALNISKPRKYSPGKTTGGGGFLLTLSI